MAIAPQRVDRLARKFGTLMHIGPPKGTDARCCLWLCSYLSTTRRLSRFNLPGRTPLRSADNGLYHVPQVSSLVGSRAFSVADSQALNHPATYINPSDGLYYDVQAPLKIDGGIAWKGVGHFERKF